MPIEDASSSRRKPAVGLEVTFVAALAGAMLWYVGSLVGILRHSPFTDFNAMFTGAQALHDGQLPYDLSALESSPFGASYRYPPLFAALLSFAVPLGFAATVRIWILLNQIFYAGSVVLLCRTLNVQWRSVEFYLFAILALAFQPTLDSMFGGQLDILLLLLLAVAVWGLDRQKEAVAASALATAAMLKIYPGIFVLYLLVRRRWRALTYFKAAFLILLIGSIVLAGLRAHFVFLHEVLPRVSGQTAWLENQSFFGAIARVFVNGAAVDYSRPTEAHQAAVTSAALSIVAVGATLVAAYRSQNDRLAFAAFVPLVLLILPNAWIHYETILLLPWIVILSSGHTTRGDNLRWGVLALIALLLAFGNEDLMEPDMWVIQSYKFVAVLLLWLLAVVSLHSSRKLRTT